MFFSPELLARRDSGFGLLWLAATLGSKSAFKKLPKRSILTADIENLCNLIAQPTEPFALRLSSNLMVGVARVYKIKQEILMTDVTSCVASIKKTFQNFKSTAAVDTQLQMVQPSVRASVLTLVADPFSALAMDFDALVANWDEYLNIGEFENSADSDTGQSKLDHKKGRNKTSALRHRFSQTETFRAEKHTLVEHHEHLLSALFDRSYDDIYGIADQSSSQTGAAFGFEDNLFTFSDEYDIGTLADELEKELGWDVSQARNENLPVEVHKPEYNSNFNIRQERILNEHMDPGYDAMISPSVPNTPPHLKRKTPEPSGKEHPHLTPLPLSKINPASVQPLPAVPFSTSSLCQEEQLLTDVTTKTDNRPENDICGPGKRIKRIRLLLDVRTELTDEELKVARTQYIQIQNTLKRAASLRQTEKEKEKIVEEMLWGVPNCIQAPILADFWTKNYRTQVGSRSGLLYVHPKVRIIRTTRNFDLKGIEEPPKKRQKTKDGSDAHHRASGDEIGPYDLHKGKFMEFKTSLGGNHTFAQEGKLSGLLDIDNALDFTYGDDTPSRPLRSSEEPGQGRHASHLHSPPHSLDLGITPIVSHKNSLFPWDNAGDGLSSETYRMYSGNQINSVDHADVRLRESSFGRRDSSLLPNRLESLADDPGFSPALINTNSQALDEDYAFEVHSVEPSFVNYPQVAKGTHTANLEINSFNFLEYAKMQLHSLPSSTTDLDFDVIAPKGISTRHVVAAAFYHCLGALHSNLFLSSYGHCYMINPSHFHVKKSRCLLT